jgi:hypothetical protein
MLQRAIRRETDKRDVGGLSHHRALHLEADFISRALYLSKTTDDTEPIVQLLDPSRTAVLNRGIEEDHLVLSLDFVDNGLENHMMLEGL